MKSAFIGSVFGLALCVLATPALAMCAWTGDWSSLTQQQQDLWGRLGWNQASWDADRPPATDQKDWWQLSRSEQIAAAQLGFGPRNWSNPCGQGNP